MTLVNEDFIGFQFGWPPTQFFPLTKLNFVPTVSNRPSARLQSKYIEIYLPTDLFSEIEARKVQGVVLVLTRPESNLQPLKPRVLLCPLKL